MKVEKNTKANYLKRYPFFTCTFFTATPKEYEGDRLSGNHSCNISYTRYKVDVLIWICIISIPYFRFQHILVCLPIEMKLGDNKEDNGLFSPEWRIGSCHGPKFRWTYSSNETHYDRCCLTPGTYTLICTNSKSKYGWGNAAFKIDGKRYCDDFVGFKAMRTVSIQGMN